MIILHVLLLLMPAGKQMQAVLFVAEYVVPVPLMIQRVLLAILGVFCLFIDLLLVFGLLRALGSIGTLGIIGGSLSLMVTQFPIMMLHQ